MFWEKHNATTNMFGEWTMLACQFGLPHWFRLKYLNNYWMDCHEILYRHWCCPEDETFGGSSDLSSSATTRLTFAVLSEMSQQLLDGKFGTNIKTSLRMNCYHFGDHLNFSSFPSAQNFNLSNTSVYDQILYKPMTLPSHKNVNKANVISAS